MLDRSRYQYILPANGVDAITGFWALQNTLSGVEGFDRVVSKFQELNQTWQNMSSEYRTTLAIHRETSTNRNMTVLGTCKDNDAS